MAPLVTCLRRVRLKVWARRGAGSLGMHSESEWLWGLMGRNRSAGTVSCWEKSLSWECTEPRDPAQIDESALRQVVALSSRGYRWGDEQFANDDAILNVLLSLTNVIDKSLSSLAPPTEVQEECRTAETESYATLSSSDIPLILQSLHERLRSNWTALNRD